MSKHYTDKAIADAEWTLEVLERIVRVAESPLYGDAAAIKDAKDAAAEALAAHPNDTDIRRFVEQRIPALPQF